MVAFPWRNFSKSKERVSERSPLIFFTPQEPEMFGKLLHQKGESDLDPFSLSIQYRLATD